MLKLKQKIRTGLKKDAAALYESLSVQAADVGLVKTSLGVVSELLAEEKNHTDERKKLSRQIGVARKQERDPTELIAGVSAISEKLRALDASIDEEIARIAENLGVESSSNADSTATNPSIPAHLLAVDKAHDFDLAELQLDCSDSIDVAEWQGFVVSKQHANVYHDAKWCALIKANFGHKPYYITCRKPTGELCGVFPAVHLNSKLFGTFLVSMPYFNYGGPLSDYPAVSQKMLEYCTQHKVTMILPLPESDEELDKQLGTKVRAQVNRAARENLEFSIGGIELLSEFYKVFSHNMRDLGTPVYSKRFFQSILESFSEQASLTVVRHKGRPVAAGFLLGYKDKLEIPWASSLRSANPLGANMYMYRQILRTAIERRYEFFDFGRSSKDASTYKYKKQWGALEHPLYWHYWLRDSDELCHWTEIGQKSTLITG